ncbi:hypothetical protein TNCV_4430571 [Trichonephila clavipes]|nr:hypothetical protein TNCV_4430571 [Trichonephila clavipes]
MPGLEPRSATKHYHYSFSRFGLLSPRINGFGTKTRRTVCTDQLCLPIRDDWKRKKGPPRGVDGLARKLTRIFYRSFAALPGQLIFFFFEDPREKLRRQQYPEGPRKRDCDDL